MTESFDRTAYVKAPVITVSTGIALASALIAASPAGGPPHFKKAIAHLKTVSEQARRDLADRNRQLGAFPDEDSRGLDNEADRCWGALRLRGQAMAMLPVATFPRAQIAADLDAKLFPQGAEFLKADYASQSTSMSTILRVIDEDGLEKTIHDVIGREFLAAVRDVQPRYEAMVKERLRRDAAVGQNLLETIRSIQSAIVNYASKVVGSIEHDDPATEEVARVALLPIANHREAVATAARGAAAPTPGVPSAPAVAPAAPVTTGKSEPS